MKMINKALELHKQGRIEEAAEIYKELIEVNSQNADAIQLLGVIFYQRSEHEKAIELFNKAIKINPKYAPYYSNKGLSLNSLKKFDEAVINFKKAIYLNNNYHEAFYNMGISYEKMKNFKMALMNYNKATELNPNYTEAYESRSKLYANNGHYNLAINDAEKRLRMQPKCTASNESSLKGLIIHSVAMDYLSKELTTLKKNKINEEFLEDKSNNKNKLDIVTFYVPIEKSEKDKDRSDAKCSWDVLLKYFYLSAKKNAPYARIILITSIDAVLPVDIPPYHIIRRNIDTNELMYSRLKSQLNYLNTRDEDTASFFLDLDVITNKIPMDFINSKNDVILTTRSFMPPINGGVIFLNSGLKPKKFLELCVDSYEKLIYFSATNKYLNQVNFRKWWGDQISLSAASGVYNSSQIKSNSYLIGDIQLKLVDCEIYNYSPNEKNISLLSNDYNEKYFIHFKGNLNISEAEIYERIAIKLIGGDRNDF